MVAVAGASALVGAAIGAAAIWVRTDSTVATPEPAAATAEPTTVTDPQPVQRANRQTCSGWDSAGKLINEAADALAIIAEGTSILDPTVRDDPERTAAVRHAGDLFEQSAAALKQAITPGATEILVQTATTTVSSLTTLSTAYHDFDESSGDAIAVAQTSAHNMSALCKRLAN